MRVRRLLLGSAALVVSAGSAAAADLPSKKAAPVDYVRVCTIDTFTGFVIPGSDTCLKVGGFVRWQGTYNETTWSGTTPGNGRAATGFGQAAIASLKMDARTTTEYGLLRGFYDIRVDNTNAASIDKAYIQFGGLHAGKVQSLFDFYSDDASYGDAQLGSDHSAVAIGYTANFAGGFYGVVSLEDPTFSRVSPDLGTFYAGRRAPDLVAALGVEQGWGKAQLSGAVHQLYTPNGTFLVPGAAGTKVNSASTEYGFAVQAGVKINVPALGAGDALFLQAAYADGALTYIGTPGWGKGVAHLAGIGYGTIGDFDFDANGSLKKTKGWNVTAAYEHQWSPTWFSNVFGGYTVYDPSKRAVAGGTSFTAFDALGNEAEARKTGLLQIGANVTWKPVNNLLVAGEVTYASVKLDKGVAYLTTPVAVYKKSDNVIQGLVRIQRDF